MTFQTKMCYHIKILLVIHLRTGQWKNILNKD